MTARDAQSWAEMLAARKMAERDRKAAEAAKIVSDRETIARGAKGAWKSLVAAIERNVVLVNGAMEGESLLKVRTESGSCIAIASAATGRDLYRLSFDARGYSLATTGGTYSLGVEGIAELIWVSRPAGVVSFDTIAQLAVESAVREA